MALQCGIVGMPNVGKSTLFNALTSTASAEAANYPFCTIEPNVGRVGVPDERLTNLSDIVKSAKVIPTQIEFVDIAGLVQGASKGEGLGNQFLSHIREVDAIVYVLRCFDDDDITHVEGSIDPLRDWEIIETELVLADLESVEKRIQGLEKRAKGGDKEAKEQLDIILKVKPLLEEGRPARNLEVSDKDIRPLKMLQLLTSKPVLYVCNVGEDDAATGNSYTKIVMDHSMKEGAQCVIISARIEEEIASLDNEEEKQEFLETIGLKETGLSKIIGSGYTLLNLSTFFTVGPKEARAWTINIGASAPEAAGVIHTDFQRGFICADTIFYDDYISCEGEQGAKDSGKMRQEGKEYIVQDGDVIHFKFNV